MKNLIFIAAVISICITGIEGCKKSSSNNTVTSGGGTGGNDALMISADHHGFLLDSCTIYIKYGALDAPANGIYDDSLFIASPDTVVTFPGLKEGVYFLYGKGYHPGYGIVIGGQNWTISNQNTTQQLTLQLSTY
jgi:hypothetical protein